MHFVYDFAHGNAKEARCIHHVSKSEAGSLKHNTSQERPRIIRITEFKDAVLKEIEKNPKTTNPKIFIKKWVKTFFVWNRMF